jgi:hypothetical protein
MKTKIIMAGTAVGLGLTLYFFELDKKAQARLTEEKAAESTSIIATTISEEVNSFASNEDLFSKYKTAPQTFSIDPSVEQKITGKQGTILVFPANSLVDKNGNTPKGKIQISLTECYEMADMIMNRLSTTSNGKMLETAGMVNVIASSNGEELQLKKESPYTVEFPKKTKKDDFHLFYGERTADGNINWELAQGEESPSTGSGSLENEKMGKWESGKTDPSTVSGTRVSSSNAGTVVASVAAAVPASVNDNCFIQISESYFRRNLKISKMDYFSWKLADGQSLNNWFVANFNPTQQMINEYCAFSYQTEVTMKLDKNGNIKDYYISKSATPEYDQAILRAVDQFPTMDMKSFMPKYDEDHAVVLKFGKKIGRSQDEYSAAFVKKFKGKEDSLLTDIKKDELDYFIFASNEMGWLNCDRFEEDPAAKIDFYVNCPSPNNTNINLAFEDFPGLLAGQNEGGKIVFHNVPKGKKVKIIGINSGSATPTMCVASATLSSKPTDLKEFKPFTLRALQNTI